jgi:salicylate hydroxylase
MTGALHSRPITVVGGGVAGLTAAIALRRRGADVTVMERASAIAEVGAGLQLSANALRVLDALGLLPALDAVSLPSCAVRLRDAGGSEVVRLDLARHRPQARFRLIHRARLIEVLEQAARMAGVRIELDRPVENPPDAPLVIGADGLHSRIRAALNGQEMPFFTGQTAWRAVIADEDATPEAQVFMGLGRHLVSYPLAGGLRNIVAVLETRDWQDEGWSHPDDPANLRAAFARFGGPVPGWLAQVDAVHVWGLFRHEVATRWQDGCMAIAGDAAHPTLPFMAQGACMAIEDAWTLAACLDATPDQAAALSRYENLRRPRTTRIVAAANDNARNYHLTGPKRLAAHAALHLGGKIAPNAILSRFDWIYDFDPVAETP